MRRRARRRPLRWAPLAAGGAAILVLAGTWLSTLPAAWDREAQALLVGTPGEDQLARAESLTRRELQMQPARANLWLRLAYIRSLRTRGFDAETASLVQRSYEAAPLDVSLAAWRSRFLLDHWTAAPVALRQAASAEILAFRDRPAVAEALDERRIADPQGRFAAALLLSAPPK